MLKRLIAFVLFFVGVSMFCNRALTQPTWTFEPFGKEKKPEQYEDRKLGSEKTADKKFTTTRRFIQNNVTHFNYFYNSNNRVNTILERAKASFKDDYSQLLPFYPFTLENTKTQKIDLDSVIISSTAGILLHDLRSDWVDNMYLLIGKAYFYRKDFDSANLTFRFINYNLFPRKKKNDDDDKVIGTTSEASNGIISIANTEKRYFLQKVVSLPPSRNDALIWLARTLIEEEKYGEATGLVNTLQNDPNLPMRLQNDLAEVTAYLNYKQSSYDSAAVYLEKALTAADTKQDKSRWEFLLGQLYEMNGQFDKASMYYSKASKHTVDPLLDIYAQLNEAKMYKGTGDIKELNNSIDNLLKMARKDKFESYKDIIYYSAAQLALQRPDTVNAIAYYKKSLKYNEGNIHYKNLAFLQLGDIAYKQKQYKIASAMYDSLNLNDTTLAKQIADLKLRKETLTLIVEKINVIEREDSLQRIALLSPAERDIFIKKLLKQLRKEQGIKEDFSNNAGSGFSNSFNKNEPVDLFGGSSKGEWYFYNASLKGKGFNEFKNKWANRVNVDNWRRKAAMDLAGAGAPGNSRNKGVGNEASGDGKEKKAAATELNYDAFAANIPNTPEKIDTSNSLIATSMLALAKLYQSNLEDYEQAILTYEEYLQRFRTKADGDVYMGLYFCYNKLGNTVKAAYYKNLLNTKFANSVFAKMVNNPAALNPKTKDPEATILYENIYNLFIEGHFEQAIIEKKKADNTYKNNYWSPQLLYIEALYYVRQKNDSLAITGLTYIIQTYPTSPLKTKAQTMIEVLGKRKEIEEYLTKLQITRATEEMVLVPAESNPITTQNVPTAPPIVKTQTAPAVKQPIVIKDSLKKLPVIKSASFKHIPTAPHVVLMLFDKVDGVYINEAKNAFDRYNRENFYGTKINIAKDTLDFEKSLLVISSFVDADAALLYYDKIKKDAKSEISWLPATKYSFLIITEENLQLLKENKNITEYKMLLNSQYTNRF
jgi:lipopolysaccharide biosynthesis regulator YciM